jgi:hypothetical protein
MNPLTDLKIKNSFEAGQQNVESLIAPLIELAAESPTLILGYGLAQAGIREEMIPYFHVCGTRAAETPIRALVVGGWVGTETITPLAIARLLAAMEARLHLAEGIEVTAYPAANLEAHRQNVFLTDRQQLPDVRCWENSPNSHVQVLERELQRYPYDAVFLLRQNPRARDSEVEAWLSTDQQKAVISDTLKRHGETSPKFRWKPNPVRPVYARTFTPMPETEKQPAEIIIGLPGALSPSEQSGEAIALVLGLLHAIRQARQEGMF